MEAVSETGGGTSLIVVVSGRGARFLSILPFARLGRTSRLSTGSVSVAGSSYCLAGSVTTSVMVAASAGRFDSVGGVASASGVVSVGGRGASVGKFVSAGPRAESFSGGVGACCMVSSFP
ncbi:unnamed protein product [Arabis nemorensis]|uniref:Uncharacterized protein n=1 Tax=Arabis nemorensis TaxID=586526 RepID=A0A565CQF4_9BRAS|nr:unnamed protein product [Arabis nemorensis]